MSVFADLLKERTRGQTVSLANSSILCKVDTWISTGIPPLDLIMGGGIPVGRMVEIYGDTSTGKSLLAGHILAETQRIGGIAVYIDTESAVSLEILEAIGVNLEAAIYAAPTTIEEVFDIIKDLLTLKKEEDPDTPMTVVWDSVAATTCEDELERAKKDGIGQGYPTHARLISQMCRILRTEISRCNIAFVFINQTRQKLNVRFGDDVATFGGKAIGFYSSIRLATKYRTKIKDRSGQPVGVELRCIVTKNKVAPPFGECVFPVVFGYGADEAGAVMEWLRQRKVITTSGGWHKLELDGEEQSFRKDDFETLYFEKRDVILQIMEDDFYVSSD